MKAALKYPYTPASRLFLLAGRPLLGVWGIPASPVWKPVPAGSVLFALFDVDVLAGSAFLQRLECVEALLDDLRHECSTLFDKFFEAELPPVFG